MPQGFCLFQSVCSALSPIFALTHASTTTDLSCVPFFGRRIFSFSFSQPAASVCVRVWRVGTCGLYVMGAAWHVSSPAAHRFVVSQSGVCVLVCVHRWWVHCASASIHSLTLAPLSVRQLVGLPTEKLQFVFIMQTRGR